MGRPKKQPEEATERQESTDYGYETDASAEVESLALEIDANEVAEAKDPQAAPAGKFQLEIVKAQAEITSMVDKAGEEKKYPGLQRFSIQFKIIGGKLFNENSLYKRTRLYLQLPNRKYTHPITGEAMEGEDYERVKNGLRKFCEGIKMSLPDFINKCSSQSFTKDGEPAPWLIGVKCWAVLRDQPPQKGQEDFGHQNTISSWG